MNWTVFDQRGRPLCCSSGSAAGASSHFGVIDRYGRPLCCSTSATASGMWPLVRDPDTGDRYWLAARKVGAETFYFLAEHPRVRDDVDGKWRTLYSEIVDGQPTLYLGDDADDNPGYECIIRDLETGYLFTVRSTTVDGIPALYLDPI